MYFKVILIVHLILIQSLTALSQGANPKFPNVLPPTPEASSIIKNSELSVGLYNGASQASIPLCQLKVSGYSLPISLNYAGNGLKVDEIPSRVGLGWSMSGFVITRSVNGKPDDQTTWSTRPSTLDASYNALNYYYNLTSANSYDDAEPDEFRVAGPGFSFKFVLDQNRHAIVIPYNNIKVEINPSNGYESVIVTNTDGVKYFYGGIGGVEATTNHTIEGKLSGFQTISTGFFLKKIELLNKETIEFEYTVIGTRQFTGISHSASKANGAIAQCCFLEQCPVHGTTFIESVSDVRYNSLLLNKIIASNGKKVEFQYENRPDNGGDKRVTTITSTEDVFTEKFEFDYFEDPSTGIHALASYNKRFFLKEILSYGQQLGVSGPMKKYSFEYNNLQALPPRLSYSQDHYGFYNGKGNQNLLPAGLDDMNFGGYASADRTSDGQFAAIGMLNKVTYPTGGSSIFEYEPHYYTTSQLAPINSNQYVGGQGTGASGTAIYTSACITPLRSHMGRLEITASIAPTCIACQVPDPGVDKIVEVNVRNTTAGTSLKRVLSNFTNIVEDIALLANNCYQIEIRVKGDYTDGFAIMYFDNASEQTYLTTLHHGPGVRVKKIVSNDGVSGIANTKYFKYSPVSDLNATSGSTLTSLNYLVYTYVKSICTDQHAFNAYRICQNKLLTSNSSGYQYLYDNNYYVYTHVLESDDETFKNGVTEHVFEVSPFNHSYSALGDHLINTPNNTNTWYNGYEKSTRYYDKALKLLKQVDQNYEVNTSVDQRLEGVIARRRYDFVSAPSSAPTADDIDAYDVMGYLYQSNWIQHKSTVTKLYDENDIEAVSTLTYFYGDPFKNILPAYTEMVNSQGKNLKQVTKYPTDFSTIQPYQRMVEKNLISPVIEDKSYVNTDLTLTTNDDIIDFSLNTNPTTPIIFKTQTIRTAKAANPLDTKIRYHKYDGKGNPTELSKENDLKVSYIWDYNNEYVVAEIKNASSSYCAYNSFESSGDGGLTIGTPIIHQNFGFTGSKSFSGTLTKSLPSTNNMIVTLWKKSGGTASVNGSSGQLIKIDPFNGWQLYQWKLINVNSISVSATEIDEVRIYPENSQMTTMTYNSFGNILTQTDINDRTVFYEYDESRHLILIRDDDHNIQKKFCYNYAGVAEECSIFYNSSQSATFSRSNCSPGQIGAPITYTIPANTFSGSNQPEADAKAQNFLQLTGLAYANANGSCVQATIYARIEYTDYYFDITQTYATPWIKFYSDIACTQPVNVSSLTINYQRIRNFDCASTSTTNNFSIVCNGNQISLGNQIIDWHDGGSHCYYDEYSVTVGGGYTAN